MNTYVDIKLETLDWPKVDCESKWLFDSTCGPWWIFTYAAFTVHLPYTRFQNSKAFLIPSLCSRCIQTLAVVDYTVHVGGSRSVVLLQHLCSGNVCQPKRRSKRRQGQVKYWIRTPHSLCRCFFHFLKIHQRSVSQTFPHMSESFPERRRFPALHPPVSSKVLPLTSLFYSVQLHVFPVLLTSFFCSKGVSVCLTGGRRHVMASRK